MVFASLNGKSKIYHSGLAAISSFKCLIFPKNCIIFVCVWTFKSWVKLTCPILYYKFIAYILVTIKNMSFSHVQQLNVSQSTASPLSTFSASDHCVYKAKEKDEAQRTSFWRLSLPLWLRKYVYLSFRRFHNLVILLNAKMLLDIHVATKIRLTVF